MLINYDENKYKISDTGITQEKVTQLIKQGMSGLINSNRLGDGWIDFDPYIPTKIKTNKSRRLYPIGHSEFEPSLLHTAYAVCSLAEIPILSEGALSLDSSGRRLIERAINFIIKTISNSKFHTLKDQFYCQVLSRTIDGKEIIVHDGRGIYTIFKAIAIYSKLSYSNYENVRKLSEEDLKPYCDLSQFILDDLREQMFDKRGFPTTGVLGKNDVDKFSSIRATGGAISAFYYFGLKQMVPGINEIMDKFLQKAKHDIILQLVKEYGILESRGIRVAWGLIETEGNNLLKKSSIKKTIVNRK